MNLFWLLSLLLLPLVGVSYVAWHVWVLLPLSNGWRSVIVGMGILCFLTLFLDFSGQLERFPTPLARTLYNVGTSSLIIVLYMVMLFAVMDLGRLLHLVPRNVLFNNWTTAATLFALLFLLFVYGRIHYDHKVPVALDLQTRKSLPHSYRVVMASDLHLGYHNGRRELARWVDMMNEERPDLIFFAGDIIDISMRPVIEEDMAEELRRLQAPVYACLGNHEYYARDARVKKFYQEVGFHLLIDEAATVDSSLVVVGRDDKTNRHRKSLNQLMEGVDKNRYVILLDHQPHHLEMAEEEGVDFQLSGHTHRGQVWPISWFTDLLYECSWGNYQRGGTHYYVSSGLGIWGGRFRIGTQSEYVVATIGSDGVKK